MTKTPRPPRHNHSTRDIKPIGICPACDGYHAQAERKGLAATPNSLQAKNVGVQQIDPRIEAAASAIQDTGIALHSTACERFARAALAAADAIDPLRQPGHTVEIERFAWTLQHPAECRPDLLDCSVTRAFIRLGVSGLPDGVHAVELTEDGSLFFPDDEDSPAPASALNPDCRDGKHRACAGDAWDEAHDHGTDCQCSCHSKGDYPALQAAHAAYKRHLNTGELTTLEGALAAALTAAAPFIAAQAKGEALRAAADAIDAERDSQIHQRQPGDGDSVMDHSHGKFFGRTMATRWLRARAATIEGKSE